MHGHLNIKWTDDRHALGNPGTNVEDADGYRWRDRKWLQMCGDSAESNRYIGRVLLAFCKRFISDRTWNVVCKTTACCRASNICAPLEGCSCAPLEGCSCFRYNCRKIASTLYESAPDQWRTQEFFSGGWGVQQIQLRTEDRENGDLGAVAP
jgi:hypothetical protein